MKRIESSIAGVMKVIAKGGLPHGQIGEADRERR